MNFIYTQVFNNYLSLINGEGGLYGRILTEVASTDHIKMFIFVVVVVVDRRNSPRKE